MYAMLLPRPCLDCGVLQATLVLQPAFWSLLLPITVSAEHEIPLQDTVHRYRLQLVT